MDWFLYDRDLRHERVQCDSRDVAVSEIIVCANYVKLNEKRRVVNAPNSGKKLVVNRLFEKGQTKTEICTFSGH